MRLARYKKTLGWRLGDRTTATGGGRLNDAWRTTPSLRATAFAAGSEGYAPKSVWKSERRMTPDDAG